MARSPLTLCLLCAVQSFSMTGFRVGWLRANTDIIQTAEKVQEAFVSCGVPFAQVKTKPKKGRRGRKAQQPVATHPCRTFAPTLALSLPTGTRPSPRRATTAHSFRSVFPRERILPLCAGGCNRRAARGRARRAAVLDDVPRTTGYRDGGAIPNAPRSPLVAVRWRQALVLR